MKTAYELELAAQYGREEMARYVANVRQASLAQEPTRRSLHRRRAVVLVAVLVVALTLAAVLAWRTPVARAAGLITVTSTADVLANDGQCTLREAIIAANTDTASGALPGECPAGNGADTIVLQAGATYNM